LAFFGGGWHKYFWFGIFFNNQFFYIGKILNLNKNDQNGYFVKDMAVRFGKKLATLPLLLVFTRTPVSQDVNHVACPCQHKI